MIISRSALLIMRNSSGKFVVKIETHLIYNYFPFIENFAVYEKMWKNIVEPGRQQTTIWLMRMTHWIPKATRTNSEYVILICFSTATMVARTCLSVTFYVHDLPF